MAALIADLPVSLLACLSAAGVETEEDLVGLYPHADTLLDALQVAVGTHLDEPLCRAVVRVYLQVSKAARTLKQQAAEVVLAERLAVAAAYGEQAVVSVPGTLPASTRPASSKQAQLEPCAGPSGVGR